ncbi:2-octaprenyl-6-methoxyphenyl hydroxylase [Cognatilysobacter bugurensis]|uniref:2-octaprenyl-6-methoxyphenyl hydroxylase n=1 Tax=Cognatilysobacter bugurensis TaxID=543356 RepID=A0A918T4L2_9GAMM|nr:2-octaprenyl-6-methoxyphenyl hydroxylase [Lysobacter bugurensis]GHA89817.1 2-octaprenyl-6-methoxyphenyl hydroxylase [Lysobacter bugurensis]
MDAADTTVHDIVIVGGGLVGASLAIALDASGLDVALVEAAPPGALPAVFDERNLSFAEATVHALDALGVMRHLRAPAGPIERIHVSRAGDFGRAVLRASDYGRREFGRVVVARDLGEALEARLRELPRLGRHRPARFIGTTCDADLREVHIEDGAGARTLRTRLLVGADGTDSAVRRALEIDAAVHDYGQTLFVTRLRASQAPDGTAYERFGADGPTALLPRGDRHFGLVHAVPQAEAEAVAALDEAAFLARAQDAFGWRVGRFVSCGPRNAYAVRRVVADALTAPRAVLVGNAAQAVHPIGAQGFNLGLRDALTLAELCTGALDANFDAGAPSTLNAYRVRREDDRARTLAFSDGLVRLTSRDEPWMRPMRGAGLIAAALVPSLQAAVVGGAMGYRGRVPALCRGPA